MGRPGWWAPASVRASLEGTPVAASTRSLLYGSLIAAQIEHAVPPTTAPATTRRATPDARIALLILPYGRLLGRACHPRDRTITSPVGPAEAENSASPRPTQPRLAPRCPRGRRARAPRTAV